MPFKNTVNSCTVDVAPKKMRTSYQSDHQGRGHPLDEQIPALEAGPIVRLRCSGGAVLCGANEMDR